MALHKLALAEWVLRLRWPGAVGALLLAGGAGYAGAVLWPEHAELADLKDRVARAERRAAAVRTGAEKLPLSPASRREQFFNALPAQDKASDFVERIYTAAAAAQLSLERGEYTGVDVANTSLLRYRITLPVKGTYAQVRQFVAGATGSVPGLALDDLALQRQNAGDAQVEARVQLSLFLVRR